MVQDLDSPGVYIYRIPSSNPTIRTYDKIQIEWQFEQGSLN